MRDDAIRPLLDGPDLVRKVSLLTGDTFWSLPAEPAIGLRRGRGPGPALESPSRQAVFCVSAGRASAGRTVRVDALPRPTAAGTPGA